jgi:high-affinity nickel-transport protein
MEVARFGLSAAQASDGAPLHAILLSPLLFAAGMSLIDTTDGVLMLHAYDWAFVEPTRKLRYNVPVTPLLAVAAMATGEPGLSGGLRDAAGSLNEKVEDLGFVIIGAFLAVWGASYLFHRSRPLRPAHPAPGRAS